MILAPESLRPGDHELLSRAAEVADCASLGDCSRSAILDFSRRADLELATALLYDRVSRWPANRDFMLRAQADTCDSAEIDVVGVIPGAFYREHTNTGADGAIIVKNLKSIGCRTERIPVESFGSLATNAAIIHRWLKDRRDQRIALVSLSKGTADVKVALDMPDAAERFQNVTAWISVSGLPQGTPLVGWLNRQPLRRLGVKLLLWCRKQSYSVVEELSDSPGSPLTSWPAVPPTMKIIHVIGFPLPRHLSHPWASRGYKRVSPLGPNDGGGFLLADAARLPGIVLPVWGTDHYLQPAWDIAALLRRVFCAALSVPVRERHVTQSASQPSRPPASKSSA